MFTLTPGQQKAVAVAVTLLAVMVIGIAVLGFLAVLSGFLSTFAGVLTPLAVAAILATMLRPFYDWLVARVRYPAVAVALVFVAVLAPLAGVIWLFGAMIADQAAALAAKVPEWVSRGEEWVRARLPEWTAFWQQKEIGQQVRAGLEGREGWIATRVSDALTGLVSVGLGVFRSVLGLLGWVVLPIYLFYMLMAPAPSYDKLGNLLPFLRPDLRKDVIYLAREFVGILIAFFRGQLLIAGAQGVLYAIGFAGVGLEFGAVIGLTLGFLNVVPYLGNILGLGVALPLAYFQPEGGVVLLAWVLGVFALVQAVEAYVLTPRIMGQRTGLHPMAIIFAMFFWGVAMDGLLGMILAIPLTAFLVVFWRLLKAKYIREWL